MSYNENYSGDWLIFFYCVPSRPVSNRMKVWRRLSRAGALQFKGAVYLLPHNDEHYELFQWLVSEVISMKGEAAFVMADKIETLKNSEIVTLFNQQRKRDYLNIESRMEELERKLSSIKKGAATQNAKKISDEFNKRLKKFEDIRKIDFFSSKAGKDLKKSIGNMEKDINAFSGAAAMEKERAVVARDIEDYQERRWVTRKRPFVDRMASAWLVKRFIDKKPVFIFIDEDETDAIRKDDVAFDIRGGEFTHAGDLCTFEALMKSFNLKRKWLKKIAEIVHELDIKDGRYANPATEGIEDILTGIRKTSKSDADALEKGMAVFEMLYASKT